MNAPAILPDASDLPAVIERARALFDAGDVVQARMLADFAYGAAKQEADFGKRYNAARHLVDKARKLQGDALLIESRARIRLADAYDFAQANGEASTGRPKNLPDGKTFTQDEAGLTAKEIHEARKLRDAEAGEPGIVQRAIEARLAQGLEPTKANLRHAIGTRSATKEEQGDKLYETPVEATRTLLALECFAPRILEPWCGKGAVLRPLEDAGYDVAISDLRDRGVATKDGECQHVGDFLEMRRTQMDDGIIGIPGCGRPDIVSNPPYGGGMNAHIAHALREHRPAKMALLLNLNVLAGFEDADRNFFMEECPPARILVFKRRLPMMHRDGWTGPEASSQMNTAWFIWERRGENPEHPYGRHTSVMRVDWKDWQDAPPLAPEGAE